MFKEALQQKPILETIFHKEKVSQKEDQTQLIKIFTVTDKIQIQQNI